MLSFRLMKPDRTLFWVFFFAQIPMLYKSSTKNNGKENVGCVIIMHTLYSATGTTTGRYSAEQSGIAVGASEDELVKTLEYFIFSSA